MTYSESDHHCLLPDAAAPGAPGVPRLSQLRHLHHHQVTSANCVTMELSKQNIENKGVLLTHSIYRTRSKRLNSLSKRQKRDLVVGTVLIIIVCVFMVCHSLKFVINMVELCTVVSGRHFGGSIVDLLILCFEGKDPSEVWSHRMNIMVAFSHLLIVLNCSVNFIIYCWKVNIRDKLNRRKFS